MPVAYLLDYAEGTLDEYDAVCDVITPDRVLPPGARYHGAGLRPDGGLRIIDLWDDDASFQHFAETQIIPTASGMGLAQPEIERVELAEIRDGAPGVATFAHVVRLAGLDRDAFAALDGRAIPGGGLPEGCLAHGNGPGDAGWMAIGYWTSRAARDAFLQARVLPAVRELGLDVHPVVEDLDLHGVMAPSPAPVS
ncbi:MAG: hypothetical protein ACEQSX_18125 [Baekduiaceae bacterium]